MSRSICIITARGGSKRIPRKNIKEFCGKPIIAYSIETALDSGLFAEVMVSTDDGEIAQIARAYGAKVPFMRSEKTSDDYATTADVLIEVLAEYGRRGEYFDILCCLYPTAPFVTVEEMKRGFEMVRSGARAVVPVAEFEYPPQRGFVVNASGDLEYAFPEYANARSQDLPVMLHDCGLFYMAPTSEFISCRSFLMEGTQGLVVPAKYVQDIDTPQDWQIAELKYKLLLEEASK